MSAVVTGELPVDVPGLAEVLRATPRERWAGLLEPLEVQLGADEALDLIDQAEAVVRQERERAAAWQKLRQVVAAAGEQTRRALQAVDDLAEDDEWSEVPDAVARDRLLLGVFLADAARHLRAADLLTATCT